MVMMWEDGNENTLPTTLSWKATTLSQLQHRFVHIKLSSDNTVLSDHGIVHTTLLASLMIRRSVPVGSYKMTDLQQGVRHNKTFFFVGANTTVTLSSLCLVIYVTTAQYDTCSSWWFSLFCSSICWELAVSLHTLSLNYVIPSKWIILSSECSPSYLLYLCFTPFSGYPLARSILLSLAVAPHRKLT